MAVIMLIFVSFILYFINILNPSRKILLSVIQGLHKLGHTFFIAPRDGYVNTKTNLQHFCTLILDLILLFPMMFVLTCVPRWIHQNPISVHCLIQTNDYHLYMRMCALLKFDSIISILKIVI